MPRWQDAVQQGLVQHPADLRFRQWAAEAKLESIVSDDGILLGKQRPNDAHDVVNRAADDLLEVWRKASAQEAVEKEPLAALANNCAVALRFCQRLDEAASVIDAALKLVGAPAALIRMRALLHLHADQGELALKLLDAGPLQPELALLRAEILARTDPIGAASAIDEIAVVDLPNSAARMATKLRLELALDLGERDVASALVGQLEKLGDSPAALKLARAKVDNMNPTSTPPIAVDENDDDESPEQIDPRPDIAELASVLKAEDLDFSTKVDGAHFLEAIGANDAASEVLHGRIDLSSDSLALRIYLRASVAAGLLVRAGSTLLELPKDVASVPFFRRMNAALLWNSGDARKAAEIVRDLSRQNPRRLDFRLWDIDCLLRLGLKDDVRKLVTKGDLEDLEGSLKEKLRLARALAAFGQEQRALRLAYRLFQTNKDRPEVWMALMSVVLALPDKDELNLARDVADEESIVEVKTGRGELLRYAIETEKQLRDVTADAIDEAHPVAKAVRGLKSGARFSLPDGRSADLVSVKNKYLGAFHSAMERYNDRFPSAEGLRRIAVEFEAPGGLDEMKSILAERVNHVRDQAKIYADGRGFLGGLAFATGVDPIEAMLGLREVGVPFRVATGLHEEREAAFQVIQRNEKSGCVVDGPTFHLIRRLKLESIVVAVCGPMFFAQTMLDRLRERHQLLDRGRLKPAGTLSYVDGQLRMAEFTPEMVEQHSAILQSDIEWIESKGEIVAALPSSDPPAIVRRMGRLVHARLFDDIFAASGSKRLFVAEDLVTRKIAEQMRVPGTWLQPILMIARKTGLLDPAEYARVLSDLSDFGEDFLSVDGGTLLAACHLDRDSREVAPGTRVRSVMRSLGGAKADAPSHANVAAAFLVALWDDETLASERNAIASAVLLQLVRERTRDYRDILAYVVRKLASRRDIVEYLHGWAIGHFLFAGEA
jgi:cellulose synthase operon protein C